MGLLLSPLRETRERMESDTVQVMAKTNLSQTNYEAIINGDFETGTTEGWHLRLLELGSETNLYGISSRWQHSGTFSYNLNSSDHNTGSGNNRGVIYVGQNFSVYDMRKHNLTGYAYVNMCSSDEYGSWAGICIAFYDIIDNEIGRIYYQFANSSNLDYPHEINLYNAMWSLLEFNRNISADFYDEFSINPDEVIKIDLMFHVYADSGSSSGDRGFSEAFFDDWSFQQEYADITHIRIHDDTELKIFPGDGSEETPYLIHGLTMNYDKGIIIDIRNTRSHIIIDSNALNGITGTHKGIYLYNVGNITVVSNTVDNCNTAIELWSSLNNTVLLNDLSHNTDGIKVFTFSDDNRILNNTVSNCYGSAIMIDHSTGNLVQFNTVFSNGDDGVTLYSADFNVVHYNTVYNCSYHGIHLHGCEYNIIQDNWVYNCTIGIRARDYSSYNSIIGNILYKNQEEALYIQGGSDVNTLAYNYIHNNYYTGIFLESAFNNNISWNTLSNNGQSDAMELIASNYNLITNNTIYDNLRGLTVQRMAGWNTIRWNDFIGNGNPQLVDENGSSTFRSNFYDEWVFPDDNADGFVDFPYKIYGSGNNEDPLPLVHPQTKGYAPYLTRPMLIYPGNDPNMELQNVITIDWADSEGCYDGSISYTLYYAQGDDDWQRIVSGLIDSSYDWDTTTVPNGWSYNLKVVAVSTCGLTATDQTRYGFQIDNEISDTSTTETTNGDITPGWNFALLLIILSAISIKKHRGKN